MSGFLPQQNERMAKRKAREKREKQNEQAKWLNANAIEIKIKTAASQQQCTEATKLSSFAYAQMSAHGN